MPPATHQCRTPHQEAFGHYLRTGERLTTAEWLARQEVKFNPWHDRLGRFTFGPGGAGGAGSAAGGSAAHAAPPAPRADLRPGGQRSPANPAQPRPAPGAGAGADGSGFRSDFVRGAVAPQTGTADTYFELNKRQAGLDRLRVQAGPHPAPAVAADLAEFQARLDANRALLDQRYRFADAQVLELGRSGLAPIDVGAGAAKIAAGQGELRDYLAASQVLPAGIIINRFGKFAKIAARTGQTGPDIESVAEQIGGAHRAVKRATSSGYQSHHLISDAISPLKKGEGPAIAILIDDHPFTESYGYFREGKAYRKVQARVLRVLGIRAAIELEVRTMRKIFGTKYDKALTEAEDYVKRMGYKSWNSSFTLTKA